MSSRAFLSFVFPVLLLVAGVSLASFAQAEPASEVERIRAEAAEGDFVRVQGRVVSSSRSRFFTLQDVTGARIVTVIPDYVLRETGAPRKGETIRVTGQYDHKTLLDFEKSQTSDYQKTWGIRVSSVERNIERSGRNPQPDDPALPAAKPDSVTPASPAARSESVTVRAPAAPAALKTRMSAARKRVFEAQKNLDNANAAHVRGVHTGVEEAEMDEISRSQRRAQQDYSEALAEISPLVEEAREAGLDETLIEMYEAGVTKPAR